MARVRKLPEHYPTPVVFVTALSDFETRSRSVLSGGCDLIAKPFTAGEVLVKALTLGLRRRFDSASAGAKLEQRSHQVRPNGTAPDSELPPRNDGSNGHETGDPGNYVLKHLATSGVVVVEKHGGIRSMNAAAAELLGYSASEGYDGHIRDLLPDKLQVEENKTLLSRVLAGTVKNKRGIKMTALRKDKSTVKLQVAIGETLVEQKRSIMCLLQPASPTVAATAEGAARAADVKPASTELTSRFEHSYTSLASSIRTKEHREACAGEHAVILEELRNRLRRQESAEEDLRRENEALKGACAARVAELDQTRGLQERQAKEHLELESTLRAEVAQRTDWERRAADQELARVDLEWENGQQKQNLRAKLKAAEAALAKLEKRRAALEEESRAVAEALAQTQAQLAAETQARAAAQQQAAETAELRSTLERELAQRRQAEEKLQSELQASQAQLQTIDDRLVSQVSQLEAKTRELQTAQAALAERAQQEHQLQGECLRLEQELRAAAGSLAQAQAYLAEVRPPRWQELMLPAG